MSNEDSDKSCDIGSDNSVVSVSELGIGASPCDITALVCEKFSRLVSQAVGSGNVSRKCSWKTGGYLHQS